MANPNGNKLKTFIIKTKLNKDNNKGKYTYPAVPICCLIKLNINLKMISQITCNKDGTNFKFSAKNLNKIKIKNKKINIETNKLGTTKVGINKGNEYIYKTISNCSNGENINNKNSYI